MMTSRRRLLFCASALGVWATTAATLAACSDDAAPRPAFEPPNEDSGTRASLPETGAVPDALAPDAPDTKPPFDPKDEPVVCAEEPCAVELTAGENHFCVRMSDGTARCWGDDARGSLGGPSPALDGGVHTVTVDGLTGAAQISAGGTTTCARLDDGGVVCWGGNDVGQLGRALDPPSVDDGAHPEIAPVALPSAATRVDVGVRSACATLTSGEVWCWGANSQRLLARDTDAGTGGPAPADLGALAITRTAAGTDTAFGITTTGELVSWGSTAGTNGSVSGRIASLSPDPRPVLIDVDGVTSFAVSSTTMYQPGGGFPRPPARGLAHACAVSKAGLLYCWGDSNAGAMGTGLPDVARLPTLAAVESDKAYPQQVAAGGEITCVRLTDGSVQCAGDDGLGALGRGKAEKFSMFFVPATAFEGHAVRVATSRGAVCALVQGGSVVCWGSNLLGELGQGTTDDEPHPSPVPVAFQKGQ